MQGFEHIRQVFHTTKPAVDFCSLRFVEESSEQIAVTEGTAEPPQLESDRGVMLTVVHKGGLGIAATSDTSAAGIKRAFEQAQALAATTSGKSVVDYSAIDRAQPNKNKVIKGVYQSPIQKPINQLSISDKFALCADTAKAARVDEKIVYWRASLWSTQTQQLYLTSDGGEAEQHFSFLIPGVITTAHHNGVTQTRSSAGQYNGYCQQGGLEILDRAHFAQDASRVGSEAVQLLTAPNCPNGEMDIILMPDQMMLQIHESIGHPLELDRILGDERNFAGTSFVTMDMFGHYQYGSELLNVTYDPTRTEQFASYAFDDDGDAAERAFIIEKGVLKRPLGGSISRARAKLKGVHLEGVANSRACSWNRPPIDRMANLNVEAGNSSLAQMVASIENGVLMHTNVSWSIDDSRNKFQFGCEMGQVIRHGKLAEIVRNPNYRGVSATFWRSLSMVGDASTFEVMGTPFCGKGEPSQVIRVGHASPACKFSNVSVFGA